MIGSASCKSRWDAYEASATADYRIAGKAYREPTPSLRDVIDAKAADQLLESERETVSLCVSGVGKPVGWFSCGQAKARRSDLRGILRGGSNQQENCQDAD